jgi:ABC-type transport system substrate-binding protein
LWAGLLLGCPALPDGPRYQGAGRASPMRGGTLMLSEQTRVRSLDPHVAFDVVSGSVIELIFDGLYDYDPEMRLTPRLAAALPEVSEHGTVLRVQLKQGLRFHNGRELTAEDVVWSFERMLSAETHSPGASFYASIAGVAAFRAGQAPHIAGLRALDRYRFEIRLSEPDHSFVHTLALRFAAPVPREALAGTTGRDFGQRPVGTGPFRLSSWDPGVRLVLERNARNHEPGQPYLQRVIFEEGVALETAFLRFRNGDQDIVSRVSPADRAVLARSPKWRGYFQASPAVDVWGVIMNCELWPFDDVHVRRAVAFAIDRERWAQVRSGALRPSGQIVPPQLEGYDPKLPSLQRFDLARAREEMRLAGYPRGLPKPVTLWLNEGSAARIYGELTQADLSKIGIQVEIKTVSFPVFLEAASTEKNVPMLLSGWQMDYPDASNFLMLLHGRSRTPRESLNKAFYANPELDRLLDAARVEADAPRRRGLLAAANELAAHDAPWAFFGNTLVPQAWQPYVKNYRPHPAYWLPVKQVWLDLPRRRAERLARVLSLSGLGRLADARDLSGRSEPSP